MSQENDQAVLKNVPVVDIQSAQNSEKDLSQSSDLGASENEVLSSPDHIDPEAERWPVRKIDLLCLPALGN
jgi:hypothetical protein